MIGGLILILGASFTLLAAIGLLRMPDLFTKMHAVAKAGAFGGSIILILAAFKFGFSLVPLILLNILFFYFTTPVAAQMISKSAISKNQKIWKGKDS